MPAPAPSDDLLACDMAAAAYALALPGVIAQITHAADYLQIRADETANALTICPAGTNDEADWKSNRRAKLVPWAGAGLVHAGLLEAWRGLEPQVLAVLREFPGMHVDATAHSRGGGLAQLAAVAVNQKLHRQLRRLTLIASMRAGDAYFCRCVERSACRITRYEARTLPVPGFRDPVPHLPPSALGYDHPGAATYLRAYGRPTQQHRISVYRKAIAKRQPAP